MEVFAIRTYMNVSGQSESISSCSISSVLREIRFIWSDITAFDIFDMPDDSVLLQLYLVDQSRINYECPYSTETARLRDMCQKHKAGILVLFPRIVKRTFGFPSETINNAMMIPFETAIEEMLNFAYTDFIEIIDRTNTGLTLKLTSFTDMYVDTVILEFTNLSGEEICQVTNAYNRHPETHIERTIKLN